MKHSLLILLFAGLLFGCNEKAKTETTETSNPILVPGNEDIQFGDITADHINEAFEKTKAEISTRIDAIAKVPNEERTFDNTMRELDNLNDALSRPYSIIYLMGSTHPDSTVRETAIKVRNDLAKMFNEISLNEDLYKSVKAYSQTNEASKLAGHQARFVEKTVREFERNGFALDLEHREELKNLLNEISELGNRFNTNIANYEDFLILKESDMAGMSEDYKKAHLQEDGTYKIGLSYPDFRPFIKNAESSNARKALLVKYLNRAADSNLDVLDTLLIKRQKMASVLGYETYASYNVDSRMAKTAETVWNFEKDLTKNVQPKGKLDLEELNNLYHEKGNKGEVESWDKSYFVNQLKTEKYGVDEEEIRQYFPLESVKDGLFAITQKLFGLKYQKVEDASVWHPDVTAYDVLDETGKIGRFYLDLHPRPNKYGHAACFPIRDSKQEGDGRILPQASLVCNFTEPTADKPALMTHDEVETFFHEFGHVLHTILSKTELASQAGFSVAQDFVEAPSQIFENWVWNYDALSLFAKHYETGEVLPKELFDKMLAAKNVMSGLNTLQQVFYGSYDFTLHDGFQPTAENTTTDVLAKLQPEITFSEHIPGTHFQAAFGHLNGYGASYYGYLWSKVYAEDMFSRFEEEGILNPEVGMAYRKLILQRGSEADEMQMLKDFLQREPNQKAFVKSIGL